MPRPDDKEAYNLDPKTIEWLMGPLRVQKPALQSMKFTTFSVASKIKHKQPVDKSVYKARYSTTGLLVESMYKDVDANKKADQLPIAELMAQGASLHRSKPSWVFMKKVANADSRNMLLEGLRAKYKTAPLTDKTWVISRTSTDPVDKKYFADVMVS